MTCIMVEGQKSGTIREDLFNYLEDILLQISNIFSTSNAIGGTSALFDDCECDYVNKSGSYSIFMSPKPH